MKAAIWPRVTLSLGQYLPAAQPVVTPASATASVAELVAGQHDAGGQGQQNRHEDDGRGLAPSAEQAGWTCHWYLHSCNL